MLVAPVSTSRSCRYCCKSPKLPGANFSAVKKSDPRPPIDVASITLPRSPVSLSSGDEVPHIFTRKSRLRPKEFLIASAKRLLQQNLPGPDSCTAAYAVRGCDDVAVGTRVSSRAPRTEPYVRLSRIRLPPRVCDGEALARPRMEDDRFRKPVVRQLRHPCPRDPILLAATPQRTPPEVGDMVPEHVQCPRIGRHCVVVEVAANDVPQPFPLNWDRLVHAPPHLLFDHLELRPHAVAPGLPYDLEFALASLAADEGEAQEVEGLRLAKPAPLAAFRRKASELDEPCLLGVQCQRKLL